MAAPIQCWWFRTRADPEGAVADLCSSALGVVRREAARLQHRQALLRQFIAILAQLPPAMLASEPRAIAQAQEELDDLTCRINRMVAFDVAVARALEALLDEVAHAGAAPVAASIKREIVRQHLQLQVFEAVPA